MIRVQPQTEEGEHLYQSQNSEIYFYGFWTEESKPSLSGLDFHFKKGTLYGISGKVGSGKSALLAAISGEIPYYSGSLRVKGSIAFVEQEPTIFSDTLRQNVIFGKSFDSRKYD
jgi:ABC-type transport system involved in cytochrome bd biosynthesis fused ATPase/permease subunit